MGWLDLRLRPWGGGVIKARSTLYLNFAGAVFLFCGFRTLGFRVSGLV